MKGGGSCGRYVGCGGFFPGRAVVEASVQGGGLGAVRGMGGGWPHCDFVGGGFWSCFVSIGVVAIVWVVGGLGSSELSWGNGLGWVAYSRLQWLGVKTYNGLQRHWVWDLVACCRGLGSAAGAPSFVLLSLPL
ncbi:hypothetical protein U1Q18_019146 [Sarracenia purpurea var. burkii]